MSQQLVAIVFVDVEASTGLPTRVGDDRGTAVLERTLDVVRDRVGVYGGRLVRTLGDGALLVFARNPALTLDEDAFVDQLLAGLHPYPAYYAHIGPLNRAGPAPLDLAASRPLEAGELRARIVAGDWIIDLRQRRAFARSHVAGTVNVELRDDLPTYLGWIIPWGAPLMLLADTPGDLAEARLLLGRIGLERTAASAVGTPEQWADAASLRSWPVEGWSGLVQGARRARRRRRARRA